MIDYTFTEEDIATLNDTREFYNINPVKQGDLVSLANKRLELMNISQATVSLIEDRYGRFCWGSNRIPLIVDTAGRKMVIKSYDYDAHRERAVLERVSGNLAPEIIYFGDDFYAEEALCQQSLSLEMLADEGEQGLKNALKVGAKVHAGLAKLQINYLHDHWLDEFHLTSRGVKVTDFGTADFFYSKKNFGKIFDFLVDEGYDVFLRDYKPIPCLEECRPEYEESRELLSELAEDPLEILNLHRVLRYAVVGIKSYIECLPNRVMAGLAESTRGHNAWDDTMELFPDFVRSFSYTYRS